MSRTNTTPILTISSVSAYNVLKSFQKHWSGTASASNFTKAHDVKVCWIQFPCYGAAVPSIKVVRHFKVPTGTCFNIRLIQLLCIFHHRNAVMSKIVLCFCWVFSNLRSRMSQKTAGVLTSALRHLHGRPWDCTYSLRLCRAWAPDFAQGPPWPPTPMSPQESTAPAGGLVVPFPGLHQAFFTFPPYFWVAGSRNGQPLTTGSRISGRCKSLLSRRGAEERRATLVAPRLSRHGSELPLPRQ